MAIIAVNDKKEQKTLYKLEINDIENIEIGFDCVIGDTKYKQRIDTKELLLRYFDWFELANEMDNKSNKIKLLASGE